MIRCIQYNEEGFRDQILKAEDPLPATDIAGTVSWFIAGIDQPEEVNKLAAMFPFGELVIEDIHNRNHLPKFELLENGCLLILKRLSTETPDHFDLEHTTLILGKNILLSFTQHPDNVLISSLIDRIRRSLGRIRKEQADFLFYRYIDLVVDEYLEWTESIREHIDELEENTESESGEDLIQEIRKLKKDLGNTRKYIFPLRDQVSRIRTEAGGLIRKPTPSYLQDLSDHLGHVNAAFDQFREMLKDLTDLHLSMLGQNSNQVMKTLTIVATLFIPLTFIVGLYGMNFAFMPELKWKWGYPAVILLMIVVSHWMIRYMKKKKWF